MNGRGLSAVFSPSCWRRCVDDLPGEQCRSHRKLAAREGFADGYAWLMMCDAGRILDSMILELLLGFLLPRRFSLS